MTIYDEVRAEGRRLYEVTCWCGRTFTINEENTVFRAERIGDNCVRHLHLDRCPETNPHEGWRHGKRCQRPQGHPESQHIDKFDGGTDLWEVLDA